MSLSAITDIRKQFGIPLRGVVQIGFDKGAGRKGFGIFFKTPFDRSSSLVKLSDNSEIYPWIKEVCPEVLHTETLDDHFAENKFNFEEFNILTIDARCAEIKILKGAARLLKHIDLMVCEVYFSGCHRDGALIDDVDLFLFDQGFIRVATSTQHHSSSGDTIYVRSHHIKNLSSLRQPRRHKISMPTLGSNGRLANQLFQYLFMVLYGLRSNSEIVLPRFEAAEFFNIPFESACKVELPCLRCFDEDTSLLLEAMDPPRNVEFWGYFHQLTKTHLNHKDFIRQLFRPKPPYNELLDGWLRALRARFRRILGLHIRRGDYTPYSEAPQSPFVQVPVEWYRAWLAEHAQLTSADALLISTDDDSVLEHFSNFNVINHIVPPPISLDGRLADLMGLVNCDLALYCNSSWSFMASLLAPESQMAFLVDFKRKTFKPFDPWAGKDFWKKAFGEEEEPASSQVSRQSLVEQRYLDSWRCQAELAYSLKHPLLYAMQDVKGRIVANKLFKGLVEKLVPQARRHHWLNASQRARQRRSVMRKLINGRGRESCSSLDMNP